MNLLDEGILDGIRVVDDQRGKLIEMKFLITGEVKTNL